MDAPRPPRHGGVTGDVAGAPKGASDADKDAACLAWRNVFRVDPGRSWGDMTAPEAQARWVAYACDGRVPHD